MTRSEMVLFMWLSTTGSAEVYSVTLHFLHTLVGFGCFLVCSEVLLLTRISLAARGSRLNLGVVQESCRLYFVRRLFCEDHRDSPEQLTYNELFNTRCLSPPTLSL